MNTANRIVFDEDINEIRETPENWQIYRRPTNTEPAFVELCKSIDAQGTLALKALVALQRTMTYEYGYSDPTSPKRKHGRRSTSPWPRACMRPRTRSCQRYASMPRRF